MHERELVEAALATVKRATRNKALSSVEIAVGPGVDQFRAALAWHDLTADTPLARAHVTWERAQDLLRCDLCDREYPGDGLESCPYCGGDGTVIEAALPIAVGRWVFAAA
jgi:Zn finger protein HypA/HybF involved in hydrogenase expression